MTDREMKAAALLAKWIERSVVIGWFSKAVVEVVMELAFDILTRDGKGKTWRYPNGACGFAMDRDTAVRMWAQWEAK